MKIEKGQRAKLWEVIEVEGKNSLRGILSTPEGEDVNGERKWSQWVCRFVGKAYEKCNTLEEIQGAGEWISLTSSKVECGYNKETNKGWTTVIIFDFEPSQKEESKAPGKFSKK